MSSKLFIISAPSGAGKSTIVRRLLEFYPELKTTISCTTRKPRGSEVNGEDYIFISENEFKKRIAENYFAEWANVHGKYYGTPKDQIDKALAQDENIILDIDVQGGMKLKKVFPDESVTIFLLPPSEEVLKERLVGRGTDALSEVEKRLKNAKEELEYKDRYQHNVVNDEVDKAVNKIISIINEGK